MQNYRTTGWLRWEGTSTFHLVQPPVQTGPCRTVCRGPRPDGFWVSSRLEPTASLGNLCQCSVTLPVMFGWTSCVSACAHCLLTWSPLRKSVSVHFVTSLQWLPYVITLQRLYTLYIVETCPQPLLLQVEQSQISFLIWKLFP